MSLIETIASVLVAVVIIAFVAFLAWAEDNWRHQPLPKPEPDVGEPGMDDFIAEQRREPSGLTYRGVPIVFDDDLPPEDPAPKRALEGFRESLQEMRRKTGEWPSSAHVSRQGLEAIADDCYLAMQWDPARGHFVPVTREQHRLKCLHAAEKGELYVYGVLIELSGVSQERAA